MQSRPFKNEFNSYLFLMMRVLAMIGNAHLCSTFWKLFHLKCLRDFIQFFLQRLHFLPTEVGKPATKLEREGRGGEERRGEEERERGEEGRKGGRGRVGER